MTGSVLVLRRIDRYSERATGVAGVREKSHARSGLGVFFGGLEGSKLICRPKELGK